MSDYPVEAYDVSARSKAKDLELVSQMPIRLREPFPQGLKPAFCAGLIGLAEAVPSHESIYGPGRAAPSHETIYETAVRRNDE